MEVPQAVGLAGELVVVPCETDGGQRGGDGVDFEIGWFLARGGDDDREVVERVLVGKGRATVGAECDARTVGDGFGQVGEVDGVEASRGDLFDGYEGGGVVGVGHVAIVRFGVGVETHTEREDTLAEFKLDGGHDGIGGNRASGDGADSAVGADKHLGVLAGELAEDGEGPASGHLVGFGIGGVGQVGREVVDEGKRLGGTLGEEGDGSGGYRCVAGGTDGVHLGFVDSAGGEAVDGGLGREEYGGVPFGVGTAFVLDVVAHGRGAGGGGDEQGGGAAGGGAEGYGFRRFATGAGGGGDADVGLKGSLDTCLAAGVGGDAGFVHHRAVAGRRCGVLVGLLVGGFGAIAEYADDEVAGAVVLEGGVEHDVPPAGGEGLGLIAAVDLGEVGHGYPVVGIGGQVHRGVAHVDGDLGRVERGGVYLLAVVGNLGDGAARCEVDLVGGIDGLRPAGGVAVAEREVRRGRCGAGVADGVGHRRLRRGAEGAEEECRRERQEPHGRFEGV